MTTVVAEAFKYAVANGFTSVNLSLTAEQSKVRWRARRVEFRSALVQREQLRSRILCRADRLALSSSGPLRRLLRRLLRGRQSWN